MPKNIPKECLDFIGKVLDSKEDFPKEALIAQAMFESGWMRYKIGENNLLGIKYNPSRHKNYVLIRTTEYFTKDELDKWISDRRYPERRSLRSFDSVRSDKRVKYEVIDYFADYESVDELIADYIRLMNSPRYKRHLDAWKEHRDWRRFIRDIAPTYATNPNYAKIAVSVGEAALAAYSAAQSNQPKLV